MLNSVAPSKPRRPSETAPFFSVPPWLRGFFTTENLMAGSAEKRTFVLCFQSLPARFLSRTLPLRAGFFSTIFSLFAACLILSSCISIQSKNKTATPNSDSAMAGYANHKPQPGSLWDSTRRVFPKYLLDWQGLSDRDTGMNIINAAPEDSLISKSYPYWIDKGPAKDGFRLTILTRTLRHHIGDTVHIVHVMEQMRHDDIGLMGPVVITCEYINDKLATDSSLTGTYKPWSEYEGKGFGYDGLVTQGPYVMAHCCTTKYVLRQPGTYRVQWKMGDGFTTPVGKAHDNVSNILTLIVN